jgi:hypothetical protein
MEAESSLKLGERFVAIFLNIETQFEEIVAILG